MKTVWRLFIWGILVSACNGVEVKDPEVNFLNDNSLLPQIKFETRDSAEYSISFWPINMPQQKRNSSLSKGTNHSIVVMNLKPATQYDYVIRNNSTGAISKKYSFVTQLLPPGITNTTKHNIDTTQFSGYILVRGLAPKGTDVIIDKDGDVVWYHEYDSVVRRPFSWTKRNSILSVYDSAHIVEFDLRGQQVLDLQLEKKNIPHKVHHDIIYSESGNIVTLTHDSVKLDLRKFGGERNQFLRADGILVLSPKGEILWTWNLLDVLDPLKLDPTSVDITHSLGHANSIAFDRDGNYLVSFRDFSQIWKINSKDGSVIWKLGAHGDIKMDEDALFIRQHSAYVDASGEVILFDNGDRKNRPYSRILSFSIDESLKVAKTKTNIHLSNELSADKMCSAERIDTDKYLVCTSKKKGIISVVDANGSVLWRVNLTKPSYRAYYLRNPFGTAQ